MKVNECHFCGAKSDDDPSPDRFYDIFHLTGWPCVLCTNCMNKEFGTTDEEALLKAMHCRLRQRIRGEEE